MLGHRHGVLQGKAALLQPFHHQQQSHYLGDGGNGHLGVRLLFIQHGTAFLVDQDCRPAGHVKLAQGKPPRLHILGMGRQSQPHKQCRRQNKRRRPSFRHKTSTLLPGVFSPARGRCSFVYLYAFARREYACLFAILPYNIREVFSYQKKERIHARKFLYAGLQGQSE